MAIQLFVPKFRVDECLESIRECLEKGWTGLGYKTLEIEKAWNDYTGFAHSHFLNSNTAGLHLAFHTFKTKYGWSDGDEVITTPLTFISTNHAIKYCNLSPVFADIDDSLCLDPIDVEKKITEKTRALIFVGIGGNIGKYENIIKLCRERNILLILDAAHMAGTRYMGKHVGLEADATVFSFQAVKNLATADSGMICFKDEEDDQRCRKLTWLGIDKDTYARSSSQGAYKWMYDVDEVGFKYHGNSIMAGIALVQLKYLDEDNGYRRKLAAWYFENFENSDKLHIVKTADGCESARHLFQIRVENREDLILELNDKGIYPGVHYRDNTEYSIYNDAHGTCPNASRISRELLSLPLHLGLTKSDVDEVSEVVIGFLK